MSRRAQGLAAVVCIGVGVLLGALMNEALNRPAAAAGEQRLRMLSVHPRPHLTPAHEPYSMAPL